MEADLTWALAGLGLVVVELLTGTFYLLVLGIAAFGAAIAAWLGQGFPLQAIVCSAIAAGGCYGVHVYRARNDKAQMKSIDAGQPASFEHWTDQAARRARVRYRGASWDALIEDDAMPDAGALLYVMSVHGNTLKVTTRRPA